ncbi:bifunctional DNA-formamidopyrimidine glycosylase/DNA-(apurinic or apyrimidinic site) lyase [candidate division KSB1 bacterium]|nr:bifunctional DNA-formamidopyrimidine glycosylase/DNA-(apurinic or apyrimidinic site) lyase [candidate division KSB1 bacterium]
MLFIPIMPELPEVETVVRGLRKGILRRKIAKVVYCAPHLKKMNTRGFARDLMGRNISSIDRIGKNIFINLDDGAFIQVHLRMTGRLIMDNGKGDYDCHDHLILEFVDGKSRLVFRDVRKFGQFVYIPAGRKERFFDELKIGIDALKISAEEFTRILKSKNRMIKPLLLDQSIVAGLGNIYVDEILFKSRVHPQKISSRISARKLSEMHRHMLKTLRSAIDNMGTTFDSFSNVNNEPGNFQSYLQVYANAGNLCPRCGKNKIKKIVVAQRGTHYCPYCQKL